MSALDIDPINSYVYRALNRRELISDFSYELPQVTLSQNTIEKINSVVSLSLQDKKPLQDAIINKIEVKFNCRLFLIEYNPDNDFIKLTFNIN